jgi:hypothetical protein
MIYMNHYDVGYTGYINDVDNKYVVVALSLEPVLARLGCYQSNRNPNPTQSPATESHLSPTQVHARLLPTRRLHCKGDEGKRK